MGHFPSKCNTPAPHEERAKVASQNRNNLSLTNLILDLGVHMNQNPIDQSKSRDQALSLQAMRRAAQKARELARLTKTEAPPITLVQSPDAAQRNPAQFLNLEAGMHTLATELSSTAT